MFTGTREMATQLQYGLLSHGVQKGTPTAGAEAIGTRAGGHGVCVPLPLNPFFPHLQVEMWCTAVSQAKWETKNGHQRSKRMG